jgi:hypothetical protein
MYECLPDPEEDRTRRVKEHLAYVDSLRHPSVEYPDPSGHILHNASPAFKQGDPETLNVVAISNDETDQTIWQGLANYAQANPDNDYWQVYKLNGHNEATMSRQSSILAAFIGRNPDVPISFYTQKYFDATITKVRLLGIADTLGAYLQSHGDVVNRDLTLCSDDIDFQGGTRGFMATLHRKRIEQRAHLVQPHLRHLPDGRFPQMSRVMQVFDDVRCAFPYRLTGMRAIGLDDYLAENGFDPTISRGGENELVERMIRRHQASFKHVYASELTAYTSPRNAYHKLQQGFSPEDRIDFFDMPQKSPREPFNTNTYREAGYLESLEDMSPQQADAVVLDILKPNRSFYTLRALDAVIWGIMRPQLEHPARLLPTDWWPDTDFKRDVLFDARRQVRDWSLSLLDAYPLHNGAGAQTLRQLWEQTDHALWEHLAQPARLQWDHPKVQEQVYRRSLTIGPTREASAQRRDDAIR